MGKSPAMYINRELSWLEFNQRVLDEARDHAVPPLERLKFLAIASSNLDEFFMVRVGGLQMLADQDPSKRDLAGMTAWQQLAAIARRTHRMVDDQYACFLEDLEPELGRHDITRLVPDQLDDAQRGVVEQLFEQSVFPVMTPMLLSPQNPFPLLVNQRLVLCVELGGSAGARKQPFAVIPLGQRINRIVELPSARGYRYMLLGDVVRMHLARFFPDTEVRDTALFRITRNADLRVQEDSASDLLSGMQQVLNARKQSACVRLEIDQDAGERIRTFLENALAVEPENIYAVPGPLDMSAFMSLSGLAGFDHLRYEAWPPRPSPMINADESIFAQVARRDILLYQPYESYDPVVRFVEEAAADPDVLTIKQILYRTSRQSPIVDALRRAARNGKQVTVLVELKARFDEARNIHWAKRLEQASVQVIYGVKGLKTHAKCCLVLRREPDGVRRYAHFGTGNYNEMTSRLYSDASFMTCDSALTQDAASFFNAISGLSQPQEFQKLEAAPIGLRERLVDSIERETRRARKGLPARIMAQLNSLVDGKVINALYRASRAGVDIDLNVRGICCLRPGVPGMSENIRVVSILDRFLEHSRILYLHDGGNERVFISSADWMPRNLLRRVELLVPIEDAPSKQRLKAILESFVRDNVKGRLLRSDGLYDRKQIEPGDTRHRHQQYLYELACRNADQLTVG